jgi:glycosyltransferase involved in cell wall biosynthesis
MLLNMIVKNESKIITRLFDSVLPIIDSYCICDTGSTDNTIQIIRDYFTKKNIPGKIVEEPFVDFGYNRTFALEQCADMAAEYILLMDADMILKYGSEFSLSAFKQSLTLNAAHYIMQGTSEFNYKNVRVVKNRHGIKYWGVTHEYVDVPKGTTYGMFPPSFLFINDVGDGGSKADKFLRDVRLLTTALEKTPNNDRYTFYLANSYKDSGQKEKAIETYKHRATLEGWIEEVWYSYFMVGRLYRDIGEHEKAVYYWMEAYNAFPKRIENLYEIATHYRNRGKNEIAYMFYRMADKKRGESTETDYLFMERDIYNFKLDYELSIIGYYCNPDRYDLAKCSMNLMAYPFGLTQLTNNVLSNYKFYSEVISGERKFNKWSEQMNSTRHSSRSEFLHNSTPSICMLNGELIYNTRFVNYTIDENGNYKNGDYIETINVLSRNNNSLHDVIVKHDRSKDNRYIGIEDIRLFAHKGKLLYNGNRGINDTMCVEHGEINPTTGYTKSVILAAPFQKKTEKNWVLFEDAHGSLKCIYGWHPLIIGDIQNSAFITTHNLPTSIIFERFRGSTNGVRVGDEIWFICHVVSYENRRFYYHTMVALDINTFKIKRYTPFFTFEKECVEYTLGFVPYGDDEFLIGYSRMDKTTEYKSVKKSWFETMFKRLF